MKSITAIGVALLLLSPTAMAANPLDVVINEVAWMGSDASSSDEWIELYNNTDADIDLSGWYILDDVTNTYALSGTIAAHGYFLIERDETATDVQADLIIGSMSLGNTGDSLELKDDNDNSIDLLQTDSNSGGWYAGTNNSGGTQDVSMERRNPDVAGDIPTNWGDNDGVTVNGHDSGGNALNATPGAQNSIYGTYVSRADIARVHNISTDEVDVYFTEAVTAPSAETVANYTVDGTIHPATATLDGSDPTIVHLVFTNGDLAAEGGPYSLAAVGVENSTGGVSDSTVEFVGGIATIAFARADADTNYIPDLLENHPDAFITMTGVVTAVGNFSYQESFFQDITAGIAIYDGPTTDSLTIGDEISISGKLAQYNGKDEITETMAFVISQNNNTTPIMLTLAELNASGAGELYEGMLVGIAQVSDTASGDTWPTEGNNANIVITDDAGVTNYTMRIDRDTDIDGSPEPAYPIDIQGIVSQYDNSPPADSGYSVYPRGLGDLQPNGGFCSTQDETQTCYSGPDGTQVNAPCQAGTQTCDGTYWGECAGEVVPSATDDSTCDAVDDDCDGETDEDVDLQNDAQNCGSCGNDCTDDYTNANGICQAGSCAMGDCLPGFGDCNTDDSDGCEVALGTDTDCTACGDTCTDDFANAAGTCVDNAGTFECQMGDCANGYADCDTDPSNGCEVSLGTVENCSACGDDCTDDFANAEGLCTAGACTMGDCLPGFGDCDTSGDSCETALTSTDNCGSCGNACSDGESCLDNGGTWECQSGCADADSDGFADATCGGTDCDDADNSVYPNAPELCDDVDNDCDSETDEDFADKGAACDGSDDDDQCANGTLTCNDAGDGLECTGDTPATEACDGQDNDCDGDIDEDWPTLGDSCDGDDADECANGQLVCNTAGNGVVCNEDPSQVKEEICNNEDDDCDGDTDEGFGQYECGVGACKVSVDMCINGEYQSCVPKDPPEQVEMTCDDGVDNDCDGYIDDADLDCTGGGGDSGCGCSTNDQNRSTSLALLLFGLLIAMRKRS